MSENQIREYIGDFLNYFNGEIGNPLLTELALRQFDTVSSLLQNKDVAKQRILDSEAPEVFKYVAKRLVEGHIKIEEAEAELEKIKERCKTILLEEYFPEERTEIEKYLTRHHKFS